MSLQSRRGFAARFGGKLFGKIILAETMEECIRACGLTPCREYQGNRCSPKDEPHAHIPPRRFSGEPVEKGGALWYSAEIPILGRVECHLDANNEPPPIYLTAMQVVELEPARQE